MLGKITSLALLFGQCEAFRDLKLKGMGVKTISPEFCLKHFGSFKYAYTDIDSYGKRVVSLKGKEDAGDHNLKWVWKQADAGMNLFFGFLENDGRQLTPDGNVDSESCGLTWLDGDDMIYGLEEWFWYISITHRFQQGHGLKLTSEDHDIIDL